MDANLYRNLIFEKVTEGNPPKGSLKIHYYLISNSGILIMDSIFLLE